MKKAYLCYYSAGGYDDYRNVNIFVTESLTKANKWMRKFNRILKKWKEYYSQFETKGYGSFKWIGDEFIEKHYDRWSSLRNINRAYITEIEIR